MVRERKWKVSIKEMENTWTMDMKGGKRARNGKDLSFFVLGGKRSTGGRNRKQIIIKVTANASLPRHLLALGLTMRKKENELCPEKKLF